MRKLNNKNKIYIFLFSIIIVGIIGILVYAVKLSSGKLTSVYQVSNNSVIFDSTTNLIDTSGGGEIAKSWDNQYYYQNETTKYDIGKVSVVYEKLSDEVIIFGENHMVSEDGTVVKNTDKTSINFTFKALKPGKAEFSAEIDGGFATGELVMPDDYNTGSITVKINGFTLETLIYISIPVVLIIVVLLIIKKMKFKK